MIYGLYHEFKHFLYVEPQYNDHLSGWVFWKVQYTKSKFPMDNITIFMAILQAYWGCYSGLGSTVVVYVATILYCILCTILPYRR